MARVSTKCLKHQEFIHPKFSDTVHSLLNSKMSNVTINAGWSSIPTYILYIAEGAVFGGSNMIIVATVLKYAALRQAKEYLVMMALSLADSLNMTAYLLAGIRRIYLVLTNQHHLFLTPWQCLTVSHNLVWLVGEHTAGIMLLTVSTDRLLAVTMPTKYIKWSPKYAWILIGIAYSYTFITAVVMGLAFVYNAREEAAEDNVLMGAKCFAGVYTMAKVFPAYTTYFAYAAPVFASASVVMYGVVWFLFKRGQQRMISDVNDTQEKNRLARQRRVTVTLGISCLCTIFFYIVPYNLLYIVPYNLLGSKVYDNVIMFLYIMANVNAFCNFFIYAMRHEEMKDAIKALFFCKSMPNNLDVWKANKIATTNATKSLKAQSGRVTRSKRDKSQPALIEIG